MWKWRDTKMAIWAVIFCSIFSTHLGFSQSTSANSNELIAEIQQMKLKVAQLEARLEESMQKLNDKNRYVQDLETQNEEMSNKILNLNSVLSGIEGVSSPTGDRLNALEKEVQSLWSASRKNNFDLHVLESTAEDAKERLKVVKSHIEKMADIVTEHWIQIRHLEEALHSKIEALEAQRQLCLQTCHFFKRIIASLEPYLFGKATSVRFYEYQFIRVWSTIKQYHIQFQGFIKKEMVRNELTAIIANDEVVFFVASALITFPVMMLISILASHV